MSVALIIVRGESDRLRAVTLAEKVPAGTRIEFRGAKRTLPQNDLMWARLTEISRQAEWCGLKLRPNDWKLLFLNELKAELRMIPNLKKDGYVNLGRSSSDLSKSEMSDLMIIIEKFAAENGLTLTDKRSDAA